MGYDLCYKENYDNAELMEILQMKESQKLYIINNMTERYCHRVSRLPPYFCIFNPTRLIWSKLEKIYHKGNILPKLDKKVVELIKNEVSKINKKN